MRFFATPGSGVLYPKPDALTATFISANAPLPEQAADDLEPAAAFLVGRHLPTMHRTGVVIVNADAKPAVVAMDGERETVTLRV